MNRLKQWFGNKRIRGVLAAAILLLTLIVFVHFFTQHPEYLRALRLIKPWVVLAIIALNFGVVLTLVFIYNFTLALCGKRIPYKEQFLLTIYSSIANFFGPLQSGPGVRSVYLRAKHQIRMRDYILATLINYSMFATISALFLLGGSRPWWQTLLGLLVVAGASYGFIKWFIHRSKRKGEVSRIHLDARVLIGLFIVTFLQVCLVTSYYFVELRAVNAHITLHQTIVYSGAANFALFVSLTPDAIGFRESFLVLSQHLHHISTAVILSANLIDRAVYALFLGLMFLLVLILHVKNRLQIKKLGQE